MQTLGFSIVELLQLVRVCGSLQLDKCPASFLSDYLAAGLAALDPDLAVKVRGLEEEQLETLCQHVKQLQTVRPQRRAPRPEAVPA